MTRVDETAGEDAAEGGKDAVGTTEDLERIWRQALQSAEYPPGAPG